MEAQSIVYRHTELLRTNYHDCLRSFSFRINPAPLGLCNNQGFDGINDNFSCPPERNALRDFYESAKGREWTKSDLWLDPYESHCSWHGVECQRNKNGENATYKLNLTSNGLSGTLSKNISMLRSIKILDLADNDLKVRACVCV